MNVDVWLESLVGQEHCKIQVRSQHSFEENEEWQMWSEFALTEHDAVVGQQYYTG